MACIVDPGLLVPKYSQRQIKRTLSQASNIEFVTNLLASNEFSNISKLASQLCERFVLITMDGSLAASAEQCLRWYCLRWRIEDWHRVINSFGRDTVSFNLCAWDSNCWIKDEDGAFSIFMGNGQS